MGIGLQTSDIKPFVTTTNENDLGTFGNFYEITTTNVLPSFKGDMSNLQGLNLGTKEGYNKTNLIQTNYVPKFIIRLSLKRQDERINKLEGNTNSFKK